MPGGQVVTWSGDPNTFCANVVTGMLKLTASTEDGREQIVGLLYPGDFVGQPFAEESPLTITALTDADLCIFPRGGFEQVMETVPRMERMLLQRTMESLNHAQQRMVSLARRNAQERIAGFLLEIAERSAPDSEAETQVIHIPLGRGEMADLLGLTIETVSRQLTRLKSLGIIEFEKGDRDCLIRSIRQLQSIANPS